MAEIERTRERERPPLQDNIYERNMRLRHEAVEDKDKEDDFSGSAEDFACAWSVGERGDEGGLGVEAKAGEKSEGDEG